MVHLNSLLGRFRQSEFAKNSFTLSVGVALAQVLPFLFYPILCRIFSAEEFGLLATLTSIISILAVVGSGKYESGIVVAQSKLQAANLAVLSLVVGFVSMLFVWLVGQFLCIDFLASKMDEPLLKQWFYVCPLAAFFIIVFNIYNEWCVREKYFIALSVNKIVNSSAVVLSKTFLGFVRLSSQGLVVGDLVGRGISALGCLVRALLRDGSTFAQTRWSQIKDCAIRFREFPLFTMPGRLLNTVGQSLPVLFIAYYYGKAEVGYFSLAMTLFSVPINIISTSVSDVYRQRATEEYRSQGNCLASFDKILKLLSLVGLVAFLALEWELPWLMRLFLGEQWGVVGHYAQLIAPAMVVMFVSNSLSGMFIVANKLRSFFWWQFYFALSTLLSVWVGGALFGSLTATLLLFSALRITAYLASIVLTRRYARNVNSE
ncbi:MAG: oligosaccharide flippase family protein [Bacteroidales bacterium]|nr:oligosaccharide flippase family protein [Bacteroidales bacterium]